MFVPLFAVVLYSANVGPLPEAAGTIQGVVVNGTQGGKPIGDVDVLLRADQDGEFVPVAKTKTDLYGKFAFQHVPLEPTTVYLPGADRDGVHYPGQRVRLDPRNPIGHVTLVVFDAVKAPSPLLATRHDIDVNVEQHVMEITETLLVTNRSRATYVGQPVGDMPPVTLRLSIPENFDRVTFGSEFHGRRFLIVDHRVVTDIPWPPGDGELKFTYRVPLEGSAGLFRRPLDLPTSNVRIRVRAKDAQQVLCNLSASTDVGDRVVFAAVDKQLPAGYTLELQIGNAPIPWMQYARWSSLSVLCMLIFGTVAVHRLRDRRTIEPQDAWPKSSQKK